MSDAPHEEMAALHALGLLDEAARKDLLNAAEGDAEIGRLVRQYNETAASLAYEAPQSLPPPELKREILRRLAARKTEAAIIPLWSWMPYAIAACLMTLGIGQALEIFALKSRLAAERSEVVRLAQSNALMGLRLATLEAKDPAYVSAKVLVAWDPYQHRGVISIQNLPAPTPGHDYQLWVLDPQAAAPLDAGLLKTDTASRPFGVRPVSTPNPGFAITLEPGGGSPAPTGSILFAVAPGQ